MTPIISHSLKALIPSILNSTDLNYDILLQDGSTRNYARILDHKNDKTYILMLLKGDDAKKLEENNYDWIKIAHFLRDHNFPVPHVIKSIPEHQAIIIEDLGSQDLSQVIDESFDNSRYNSYFDTSFSHISQFLKLPKNPVWTSRAFDGEKLSYELAFFKTHLLDKVIQWQPTEKELSAFQSEILNLSQHLAKHSLYFVHRDFHSRNLMIWQNIPWIIDFQDARLGPASYDLVSLCFDSYLPFSIAQRKVLLQRGLERLKSDLPKFLYSEVVSTWPAMLLQRQLKALGSFGYLTGKQPRNYLTYAPVALETLSIPEITNLKQWPYLTQTLIPYLRLYNFVQGKTQ